MMRQPQTMRPQQTIFEAAADNEAATKDSDEAAAATDDEAGTDNI